MARLGMRFVGALFAVTVIVASTTTSAAGGSQVVVGDAEALGDRGLGERCTRDCQCESLECKGFRCVARDYSAHPILDKGAACSFDGDCRSCDCAGGRCH